MVVTFGGDGTVLRVAAWLVAEKASASILPVRMGSLSFLGELQPSDVRRQIEPYLEGEYWLDERAMLLARSNGIQAVALNDVVVGRGAASRAVRLEVCVDGAPLAEYVADGMVVASPTGSTGYSLAAGGPVLAPNLDAMLLQPVAPHLANLRSLVVPASSEVRVLMHTLQPGVLTVDGHVDYPLVDGHKVTIGRAAERTAFARRGTRSDFYRALGARLAR
jgi:NAD+ kinase